MTEFIFKTDPYDHQLQALTESCDKEEYALFMEMGCGKSKVAIDNFVYQDGLFRVQNKMYDLYNETNTNSPICVVLAGINEWQIGQSN